MNDHPESDGAASGVARRSDGAGPGRSATPGYSAAPGRGRDAILALDQGTTSSRAVVFDRDGQVLGSASRELTQHYPRPGWVEHDPREIWRTQMEAAREALARAGLDGSALTAVGIANQRETALLWDAETGAPVGNAVVWQCRRTAERCAALRSEGREEWVRQITGLPLDPYFSATKFEWLLAAHPEARQLLRQGRLRCGTVDSFLIWHLTGGRRHVTDVSNASRTMLFDLRRLDWDDELLRLFGIPRDILPQPIPSSGVLGHTDPSLFGASVPIAGVAGDQQAALFGQACFAAGDTKNTYGTGCFLLMNTGGRPVVSSHGLVSTVAWALGSGSVDAIYALEGSVFVGGAAVQWLRDGLGIIQAAEEIGPLAATVADNGGVFFVPALTGLGAPFWDPAARGVLIGITRGTRQGHLARATEEAICYQTRAVLEAMVADAGTAPSLLRVDGGAVGDDLLLQLQADVLRLPVRRQVQREATAFGAAALAALGVGLWSLQDIADRAAGDRTFEPGDGMGDSLGRSYRQWLRAVERSRGWAE